MLENIIKRPMNIIEKIQTVSFLNIINIMLNKIVKIGESNG